MTDPDQAQIDRIEADRRRRERALLFLLIGLCEEAEAHAGYAVKTGNDPVAAARNVWLGNPRIQQDGAAPLIAESMAETHVAGARRASLIAGIRPGSKSADADTIARLTRQYAPQATDVAERTWGVIERNLSQALRPTQPPPLVTPEPTPIRETIGRLREAFDESQVTEEHPHLLETQAERIVVSRYNDGMADGSRRIIDPKHHLVGFAHVSVLDRGTTDICKQRHGIVREASSDYWKTNWCPLHFGCRSIIYPLFGASLTPRGALPTIPPAPGFGHAPSADLGSYFGITQHP